ncbi:hypothetical protein QVG61_05900 [Thiohalobacter sp. IOR34]|uniref:hypothetical protein n=1 Tax=Thiohalobacter sp. IOR34 TaxID=3057176 RepID=UPI0025B19A95|nr:hypothetical protein [Thiohalobacter sp. IOR34]WJW76622.1 hypothetical protein QVG61_05900 [Thiohalobacter sp. IOR34]
MKQSKQNKLTGASIPGWPMIALLLLLLTAGCATPTRTPEEAKLFFPPLPNPPRIQYLARFSTQGDLVADASGLKDFLFGKESMQGHLVRKPYGVALYDGKIYVVDIRGNGYGIYDLKNRRTDFIQGFGNGSMKKPINISIAADGTKYITDTGRNQILVYSRDDKYVKAFGTPEEFKPIDCLIAGDRLYVTDLYHHRVHVLDRSTGDELFSFGSAGSKEGQLFQPTNLALSPDGRSIYVSDSGNFRVQKFTLEGKYIRTYGGIGDAVGHFARPKGIAVDRRERLYVVDAAFENVQIFDKDGTPLLFFGEAGDKTGNINLPADIYIDYDNVEYFRRYAAPDFNLEYVILVSSQFGINKVTAFGFGKMSGMDYSSAPPKRD